MKRRNVIRSLAGLPVIAALPLPAAAQYAPQAANSDSQPLKETAPDAVADSPIRFFTAVQLSALRRLGELVIPAWNGRPGAVEAGAADFLDFLLSQSPADRQKLYREGLDRLNEDSRSRHGKTFADLSPADAASLLSPLSGAWTYAPPSDSFAAFLRTAKDDLIEATRNSREWSQALSRTSRGAQGIGSYWLPLD